MGQRCMPVPRVRVAESCPHPRKGWPPPGPPPHPIETKGSSRGLSVTAAGHAREADLLCVLRELSRLGRWTEAPIQACEHPSPHSGQALSSVQKTKLPARQASASSRTRPRTGLQRTAALPLGGSPTDGRGSHRPDGHSSRFIRGLLSIRPREPHSQGVVTRGPAFFFFKRACLVNTSNQKL